VIISLLGHKGEMVHIASRRGWPAYRSSNRISRAVHTRLPGRDREEGCPLPSGAGKERGNTPNTIIVSDLHVDTWDGRRYGRGERRKTKLQHWCDFLDWCENEQVNELIVNGDLTDAPPYEGNISFRRQTERLAIERLLAYASRARSSPSSRRRRSWPSRPPTGPRRHGGG
jgi:hypothetical protein